MIVFIIQTTLQTPIHLYRCTQHFIVLKYSQGDDFMKEEKKSKNKLSLKAIIPMLIGGVAGGLGGYFGAQYLDKSGMNGTSYILVLFGSAIAIYLQLILHEAGHLIFGMLSGYKFVSFRVGSFTIYKKEGKIHFGSYKLAGTGGQCLMAPPDLVEGKIPYALFNFGGVIVNVIVSVIALTVLLVCELDPILLCSFVVFIATGLFAALTNGIPLHLNGIDNDGYNALSLGKNPDALRTFWLQLKVNELQTEGKRLKDMPEEWFQKPSEEGMKNNMIAAIEAMRCNRLLDMHCFEEVNQAITDVLDGDNNMVGVQKMLLQIDRVFCEIMGERKEEILNEIQGKELAGFMKAMKTFPSVVRTQYAYALLIQKEEKEIEKYKKQFEKIMKKHPYKGEIESEGELIAFCEKQIDEITK